MDIVLRKPGIDTYRSYSYYLKTGLGLQSQVILVRKIRRVSPRQLALVKPTHFRYFILEVTLREDDDRSTRDPAPSGSVVLPGITFYGGQN
ncbi:hypothetical protein RRG08_031307 [Elysia crispata]|uniref:Uncharacterized protein n=1 Tax=Elysia crispata TaxID=231223 RepID=A0AAE0YI05_9GAST|nr:hypothetical protein RRG08_031307 [Elysia crispata]